MKGQFTLFNYDSHPMSILLSMLGCLSAFYHEQFNSHENDTFCVKLISKIPTLVAYSYRVANGMDLLEPRNDLNFMQNFLYMMFTD